MKIETVVLCCALIACGSGQPAGGTGGGGAAGGAAGGTAGAGGGTGGSGGSGGGSASGSCTDATDTLCDRASACGGGTKVVVTMSGVATAEHNSVTDCKNYYRYLVCPNAASDGGVRDWAHCRSAISAAACLSTSKGDAAPLPTADCPGLTL